MKSDDGKEYAEIDVETIGESEMAVHFNDGDRSFWVPQSVMEDWPDEGDVGTAIIQMWFAVKEGLA